MTTETASATAASSAGTLLAAATRGVGAVRQAPKPLHPRGSVAVARVSRCTVLATGVTWLDEPDSDLVLVRRSRAAGLPRGWPDVHGLALRVALTRGGVGDLLLASTGWGPRGRFLLHAGRHPETLFFGSLLPYRSAIGPVVLGALPRAHDSWVLLWARARGPWQPFAQLELGPDAAGREGVLRPGAQPAAGPGAVRRPRAAPPSRLPRRTSLAVRTPPPRCPMRYSLSDAARGVGAPGGSVTTRRSCSVPSPC